MVQNAVFDRCSNHNKGLMIFAAVSAVGVHGGSAAEAGHPNVENLPAGRRKLFSDKYSNSFSRTKICETIFLEPEWRGICFPDVDPIAAMNSVLFSSKSELSSRAFGRLKFSALLEYLSLFSGHFGLHFGGLGLNL